jgi:uncharacterized membrane protein YgdD (TMEM256/DUF423 family)
MHKGFLQAAALLGAIAVAVGAFGAHGLKQYVSADTLNVFETGVRYQFYHALAILAIGIIYEKFPNRWMIYAGNCFITGIILFSGSLYTLTILRAADMSFDKIGIVTPLGGLFFIAGWLSLFIGMIKP